MDFTVVVPTYRRPRDLARCLDALDRQELPPRQLVVVCQKADQESLTLLAERPAGQCAVEVVTVDVPGTIAAMNAGMDAAREGAVAFTDDDAAPWPDWLKRHAAHYEDAGVAGVGGRDRVHENGDVVPARPCRVGTFTWCGGLVGNHHVGEGEARDVDSLKGVNMSFRRAALGDVRCDPLLRGPGAQYGLELTLCWPLRRRGMRLVYDPEIIVDHYPGVRTAGDTRARHDAEQLVDRCHNVMYTRLRYDLPLRTLGYLLYSLAIGHRSGSPGIAALLYLLAHGRTDAPRLFAAHCRGLALGMATWWRARRAAP